MKIAFFTPLSPTRSGIADYSEELLQHLKKHVEIHLFVDDYEPTNKDILRDFKVFRIADFEKQHLTYCYQACLYHIGNNKDFHEHIYLQAIKYSGIVVMHDFAIHHLIAGMLLENGKVEEYLEEVRYNHGEAGISKAHQALRGDIAPLWEDSITYPMNRRIIEAAKGVIVHSNYSSHLIKNIRADLPVKVIPLHCANILDNPSQEKEQARRKLKISEKGLVLASFGHIVPTKRLDVILKALRHLKADYPEFSYYIVGEETDYPIRPLIRKLGLNKNVFLTGYTDLETFKEYMKATDICLNLRYPIQGENSGSLSRLLGMGKAVIVSNVGPFAELSSDFAIKIDVDDKEITNIVNALRRCFNDTGYLAEMGEKAHQYAKNNCLLEKSAFDYANFIKEVCETQGDLEKVTTHSFIHLISEELSSIGFRETSTDFILNLTIVLDEIGFE